MILNFTIYHQPCNRVFKKRIRIERCLAEIAYAVLFTLHVRHLAYTKKAIEDGFHAALNRKIEAIGVKHRIDINAQKVLFLVRHYATINCIGYIKLIVDRVYAHIFCYRLGIQRRIR